MNCSKGVLSFGEALSWVSDFWPTPEKVQGHDCYIFARALKRFLGDQASLWEISLPPGEDEDGGEDWVVHVVVKVGNCFLDRWGAWTGEDLLEEWLPKSRQVLRPFDPNKPHGIKCPAKLVDQYFRNMLRLFGDPWPNLRSW